MASEKPTVADLQKEIEELKKLLGKKVEEDNAQAEEAKKMRDYMEEYVEVKLFKDNDKYKDDVYVAVNGENCVIKRGERVKIKRKFAEVLDNSEHQDYETSIMIETALARDKKLADM